MKKIWKRCLAYFIDIMVVMLIVQCISGTSFFNPRLDEYQKYYNEYTELAMEYSGFKSDLRDAYENKKLSLKEYEDLVEDYPTYGEFLKEKYEDQLLSSKEYDTIMTSVDKVYLEEYERLYYLIEKNSVTYLIVNLIVLAAYFIGFNMITNGQTLGKKLLRLKVVSSNSEKEKVSFWKFFVRFLLLYQPLYYLMRLIGIYFLGQGDYYSVMSIIYDIQYYLEFIIILTMMIRLDGRGIHDLLAKTRVVLYDRDGREIEDKNEGFLSKKIEEKKKKIIDAKTE